MNYQRIKLIQTGYFWCRIAPPNPSFEKAKQQISWLWWWYVSVQKRASLVAGTSA